MADILSIGSVSVNDAVTRGHYCGMAVNNCVASIQNACAPLGSVSSSGAGSALALLKRAQEQEMDMMYALSEFLRKLGAHDASIEEFDNRLKSVIEQSYKTGMLDLLIQ
jgi:hypothetical protein